MTAAAGDTQTVDCNGGRPTRDAPASITEWEFDAFLGRLVPVKRHFYVLEETDDDLDGCKQYTVDVFGTVKMHVAAFPLRWGTGALKRRWSADQL